MSRGQKDGVDVVLLGLLRLNRKFKRTDSSARRGLFTILYVVLLSILIMVAFFWFFPFKKEAIGEFAEANYEACIKAKGFGGWRGSSGISLERYCKIYGDLQAVYKDKREHPENY